MKMRAKKRIKKEVWDRYYPQARAFYRRNGHLRPSRNGEDSSLAWWIDGLRKDYEENLLPRNVITAMEKIGMVWNPRAVDWEKRFNALKAYLEEHNNVAPRRGELYDGVDLGNFLHSIQNQFREGSLSRDRQSALEGLGIVFKQVKTIDKKPSKRELDNWEYKYSIAVRFSEEFGHLYIPAGYLYCSEKMGDWINTQRRNYKRGVLSDFAIEKLEAIGIDWNPGQKPKPKVPPENP